MSSSTTPLPRPGTIVYDLLQGTDEQQRTAVKKFKLLNTFLFIPLYRIGLLPLLGFSRIFLLLITVGRRSGRRRVTPLEYHRINGVIHIFSGRGERADWFKNLREHPHEVSVKLGFHTFKSIVEVVSDIHERLEVIKWYVTVHPRAAKHLFGWNPETDELESDILDPIADLMPIIRLHQRAR